MMASIRFNAMQLVFRKQVGLIGSIRHASLGKRHYERKLIAQPISTLYQVVSDVSKYHEFVPWCKKSSVLTTSGNHMTAELEVGFKIFSERYISKVEMSEPSFVSAVSTDTTIFEHLKTEWKFTPASNPNTTWEVVTKMVKAFENRCTVVQLQAKKNTA